MIGALHEGQPRDDLRRVRTFERGPPGVLGDGGRHEAEIAARVGDRREHAGRTHVRHERHREAEVKTCAVAHRGLAGREIGMHRKRCLHIGERRDDDAPDALRGIERQDAMMALHQAAHHVGLARRTERRAGLGGLLGGDQRVDDVATFHQQAVHRLVDAIDIAAQIGERGRNGVHHDAWF